MLLYRVARKKRPELSHGDMQQSRLNESAEKHVCNEQTSSNTSMNFHLKRFHTREIVSHVIKQCVVYFGPPGILLLLLLHLRNGLFSRTL